MVRYWEVRRIWYNLALFALCVWWVVHTWPHFEPALTWFNLGRMMILAAIANVAYSTAYAVDAVAFASLGEPARTRWRTALFIAGTLFALLVATYWIGDEIYPDVQ
jgi:4-amino-4-deoxy-L-arabinose transferase-like glycosyltransferase